jgi:uncharacterized protein YjeT (DUF2065 family)
MLVIALALPNGASKGKPPAPDFLFDKKGLGDSMNIKKTSAGDRVEYFLCVFGMVMIVEGLPYFAVPGKIKVWVLKLSELPDSTLRMIGLLLMLAGLGLVYLGRS